MILILTPSNFNVNVIRLGMHSKDAQNRCKRQVPHKLSKSACRVRRMRENNNLKQGIIAHTEKIMCPKS